MLSAHHIHREEGDRPLYLDIAASANNIDLHALAVAAGWTSGRAIIVTILPGVVIGSSSTATHSMVTGGFGGVKPKLIVQGMVLGKPGDGGNGGHGDANTGLVTAGSPGSAGGPAIRLDDDVEIDNGAGLIGGGGGGGGGSSGDGIPTLWGGGGGPGGGGAGHLNSSNGAVGTGSTEPGLAGAFNPTDTSGGSPGRSNSAGTYLWGGAGGGPGDAGAAGDASLWQPGGAGAAAGNAIKTQGHSITWISGNDSAHLKGPVVA